LTEIPDSGSRVGTAAEAVRAVDVETPARRSKWYRWRKDGTALVYYLLDSEVHTFAFSVAANAILSFIPFIVLLYTLALSVFHSQAMVRTVSDMVRYFLPSNQDFFVRNLDRVAILSSRHGVQFFSLVMILVSCTGIFLPLEVALNKAWGVTKGRNYLSNQVISFGLAALMLALGMGSVALNAKLRNVVAASFNPQTNGFMFQQVSSMVLAVSTGVASILFFFSIYWLLPNRRISPGPVFRTAFFTGIIWLVSKYAFEAVLPYMDLAGIYGAFSVSVSLLFWAYLSGLILFAGAQFSVARAGAERA
jgi:membrane protein/epoxyqueuosine reductase